MLGEEQAEGQGSKCFDEWANIWLATGHQQCSPGRSSKDSSVQYVYQQPGCKFVGDIKLGGVLTRDKYSFEVALVWICYEHSVKNPYVLVTTQQLLCIMNSMNFNNKCWILNLGWNNARHEYKLGGEWLKIISKGLLDFHI